MPLALAIDQKGILPDHMIAALVQDGAILPAYDFVPDQIQPASLDLRLGEVAFRVRASFLPGPHTTVAERIDELKLHEIALGDGAVLETSCVYIVPLIESLALPDGIAAAAATGRRHGSPRARARERGRRGRAFHCESIERLARIRVRSSSMRASSWRSARAFAIA